MIILTENISKMKVDFLSQ